MGVKLLELPDPLRLRRQHTLWDEFHELVTGDKWTTIVADASAVAAVIDGAGGILSISPAGGVDNDEAYVHSTAESFLLAANKTLHFEAEVSFTEANTDDANVLVGLMDGVAADAIVDDGAGPKSSYSGIVFYKVDGGTKWIFETSKSTTQTTSTTNVTAGAAYQTLSFDIRPVSSTQVEVVPFIDGVQCRDNTTGALIKHYITFASATEMAVVFGVKNGGGNAETLLVDYVESSQLR
jgi:hypothetical protein